jgi:prolyl-tRNA synthetase
MAHGDDKGIVMPPMIAPIQVVIIPIFGNVDDEKLVMDKVAVVKTQLDEKNIRYHVDAREGRPGFKYFEWERKGVPLRLEIGPKDVAKGSVVLVDRLTATKNFVPDVDLMSTIMSTLDTVQKELLARSVKFREDNTKEVTSYDAFKSTAKNSIGFIFAPLCVDPVCEEKIKEETGLSTRCVPLNQEAFSGKCVYCESGCERKVLFAKAY